MAGIGKREELYATRISRAVRDGARRPSYWGGGFGLTPHKAEPDPPRKKRLGQKRKTTPLPNPNLVFSTARTQASTGRRENGPGGGGLCLYWSMRRGKRHETESGLCKRVKGLVGLGMCVERRRQQQGGSQ